MGALVPFLLGCRSLSDGEAVDVAVLLSFLEGHLFRLGRRDVRFWSPGPLEGFSCKSFFHCLVDPSPLNELVFLVLWRIKVPRKVRFFTWLVLHGHANTLDMLFKNMPLLVGAFVVFFCRNAEEDQDHIFCYPFSTHLI